MKILGFIISFVLTLILTPLVIKLSYRKDLLDYPKSNSIHKRPLPMMGGVVIFFVFFITSLILKAGDNLLPFFLGSLIIMLSGIYDDLKGLNAAKKLFIQFIAVLVLTYFGIMVTKIKIVFGPTMELGIFSIPLTIFWFIVIINLINVIDGLDGLAVGLCAIVFFFISIFTQDQSINLQLLVLLGSIAAFLLYNFYPAKIFLGNNGSAFLGFSIAYFALTTSQKSTIAPLLALPCGILLAHILDLMYAIFRRARHGGNIFKGDKNHLHHLMLNVIRDHRMTVLLFYLLSAVLATITIRFITLS